MIQHTGKKPFSSYMLLKTVGCLLLNMNSTLLKDMPFPKRYSSLKMQILLFTSPRVFPNLNYFLNELQI